MSKPAILPKYATDATLTGGPQITQAPRLQPSDAFLGQGAYQDHGMPARFFGWLLGVICDWLAYFQPVQILNWFWQAWDFPNALTVKLKLIAIPNGQQPTWYLFGYTSAPAPFAFQGPQLSPPGTSAVASVSPPGSSLVTSWEVVVSNANGSLLVAAGEALTGAGTFLVCSTSADRAVTWTLRTVDSSAAGTGFDFPVVAGVFDTVSGLFCLGYTNVILYTSADGVTWVQRTGVGTGNLACMAAGGGWLVKFSDASGVVGQYSVDGGVTWTNLPAHPTSHAVDAAYLPSVGFCVIFADGSFHTIIPGGVWAGAGAFGAGKAVSIAADGSSRLAVAYRDTTLSPGSGVYFSDNFGASFRLTGMHSAAVPTSYLPLQIKYNGFDQWGLICSPTTATNKWAFLTTLRL